MKNLIPRKKFLSSLATVAITLFTVSVLNAQVIRPYTNIFSDNIRGGHNIIGNTITAIYSSGSGSTGIVNTAEMNDFSTSGTGNYTFGRTSAYGNDNSNVHFVDVDGNSATTSSSSANLSLPAGTNTIKFARLYWGGRINGGTGGANNINLRTAMIKFDAEGYQTIVAAPGAIDKSFITGSGSDSVYQVYFDVTAYVNARENGTYTMADITAATGSISGGGRFAGWAIVIVYENLALSYSSLRVYDGFLQVYNDGSVTSQTITLNGLNPPATFSLSSDAYMSMVSWEGDANLAASAGNPEGDFVKVNGTVVSNAVNPLTNFWNGTISKNGVHLSGNKTPDFKNQMGIDIDEVEIGTGFGITPATTNINIQFGTESDQYFPSIFAFTMKTNPPLVELDKIVKDTASGNAPWQMPNGLIDPNEIITYTITGKNTGSGNALNCVITDTLPTSFTYRTGSLKVNVPTPGMTAGFKTDAGGDDAAVKSSFNGKDYINFFIGTGATSASGGTLAPNDSFSIQFQCIVPSNVNAISFVSNTVRITGTEQDGITPFVDDGTAIIGTPGIGLPVKMTAFTVQKQNGNAVLSWTTVTETNNDHFDIERSTDGINFSKMGMVHGNGSTTDMHHYQYSDPINTPVSIIYYRLKVVDIDYKWYLSRIAALRLNGWVALEYFTVYPSPFTSDLKLQISSVKETAITIRINNSAGQLQINYRVTLQPGGNIVVLSNLDNLRPGIYLIDIISEGDKLTQKIIKL
jgi:uncharacterized repeat protein (TIGR01451 family)